MNYLFAASIGPVQEFIASARRSRDLWFGSWLLGELSKAAAQAIVKRCKVQSLIFPHTPDPNDLDPGSDFGVVNKILAVVDDPGSVDAEVVAAMQQRLRDIMTDAYKNVPRDENFLEDRAISQVMDLPEYYSAAAPLESVNYKQTRDRVERLLLARKTTREFGPTVEWADTVPKSSLDGLRESVIHERLYGSLSARDLYRSYGVRPGERLCGVGLLKRRGNRGGKESFFSTSHVAALPLLHALTDKEAADRYIEALKGLGLADRDFNTVPISAGNPVHPAFGRHDGQLLFEERLKEYFENDAANLKTAKSALNLFLTEALEGKRPLPYYALLHGDGDRMGKAIELITDIPQHRGLSGQLTAFAGTARSIVEAHSGWLVYSGGDDVLAFVPLHTALECAGELARVFAGGLANFPDKSGKTPTLSIGMAVAHHLDPLSDALVLARKAEKIAKGQGGNSLSVIVSKRGGPDLTVTGPWGEFDQRLADFVSLHNADAVPDGAGFELRDAARRLAGVSGEMQQEAAPILLAEAKRILGRKRAKHGMEEMAEGLVQRLLGDLEQKRFSVAQLADELIAARVFAEAKEKAATSGARTAGLQPGPPSRKARK